MDADRRKEIEELLDIGHGSRILKNKECAEIVEENWQHFNGVRYKLIAYVIMPNHVHVLINAYPGFELGKIITSWKGYSARRINQFIANAGRAGSLTGFNNKIQIAGLATGTPGVWQRGYRDRYVSADISKKDAEGNTTIMSAIGEYWCEDIKHFMQYKPDVNVLNNKGESALFIAVVNGSERNAMILLENKANPNFICSARHERILFDKKDHQFCTRGKSLLDIATMMGESGVVSV